MKDNDASSTAFTVAQGLLFAAQTSKYGDLVNDNVISVSRQILLGSEQGRHRLKQLESWWFCKLAKLRERLLLPGISLHYVLRKRHIEQLTLNALSDGISQVVVLGAGFDSLCWRLQHDYPKVNFIEIDHPATQKQKVKALEQGATQGKNMHFLAVDFGRQKLQTALTEFEAFDPKQSTLFICEGVLMYLNEKDVDTIFDSIRALTGCGTQFIFSTLEPKESPRNTVPKILYRHLEKLGEPVLWDIDSHLMQDYLQTHQCELHSVAGGQELVAQQIQGKLQQKMYQGEYFVHCTFRD
ncbi:class I SAM-dependent methyltransferase [Pseudoalteromonas luteoviolacea]|uniref:class I SAM-dependent methyltransferase n=1 Tax=Pseudoalteromonas luteoviolacea TaxID=43657 RepID=UPI001B39031C|nr:SAM-dependent methyltransferase [Pseudoalteromonas luteoviolacea]MBQ4812472.1 class I SAM-dependent methyltransferase [Pseudoalteromonas luteoviolacea]